MTRTRTITRRALVVAGTVLAMAGPFAPGLGSSDAHTCAYAEVLGNGVGSCHSEPWPSGHHCVAGGEQSGTAEFRACVD